MPISTSRTGPFTDPRWVRSIVGDAKVVGLARGAHGTAELTQLSHRLLRYMVEKLGFRTLAIESSTEAISAVDVWLRTGNGDLGPLLAGIEPWWRTPEFMDVLAWMRERNQRSGHDAVRLVGLQHPDQEMHVLERLMADDVIRWVEGSGQKVLYWSGSHSAVGHRRVLVWQPGDEDASGSPNAGARLRDHFGEDYRSLGLSFHHGSLRWRGGVVDVPASPAGFLGTLLDRSGREFRVVDLRRDGMNAVRVAAAQAPLLFRMVGPHYTPQWVAHMRGGTVAEFFDAVLHVHVVTPSRPPP